MPIPGSTPAAGRGGIGAGCRACLALLDQLHAEIARGQRQSIEGKRGDQAQLHADFCRCLERRIRQLDRHLARLIDAAVEATPADDDAARAFLRQARWEAAAAYREFCRTRPGPPHTP